MNKETRAGALQGKKQKEHKELNSMIDPVLDSIELLPPTNDLVFREIFGDERHKKMTICLLNAILNNNPKIQDLQFQNPAREPINPKDIGIRLDIQAKIGKAEYVDIEMQCYHHADLAERALHYISDLEHRGFKDPEVRKKIGKNAPREVIDYAKPRVIGIWLLKNSYPAYNSLKQPVHEGVFTFKPCKATKDYPADPSLVITDKFRLIVLELPKFKVVKPSQKRLLDAWIRFFKNPLDTAAHQASPYISEAYQRLCEVSQDDSIISDYRAHRDGINDIIANTNAQVRDAWNNGVAEGLAKGEQIGITKGLAEGEQIGIAKGLAEGRAEGLAAGRAEGKLEIAQAMLSKGMPIEVVAECTGIPLEQIERLKQKG